MRTAWLPCIALPALLFASCGSTAPPPSAQFIPDGQYDSEFPGQATSPYLEKISASILRLNAVSYYRTYFLGSQERLRIEDLNPGILAAHEQASSYSSSSTSGTASVIASSPRQIALLTCAHIVNSPDTVYTYQYDEDHRRTNYLASVSIKSRVLLYIASLPDGGLLTTLTVDRASDLAVVGHQYETPQAFVPPSLPFRLGVSADLHWGTFLYLFGYPAGNRVVTRGIVSSPNKDHDHAFLVDAVFGRGFSGGMCVALRDGVPNFEVVGMVKMVPARSSYVLTPGRDRVPDELDMEIPYDGKVYIERRVDIDYGTSQAISAETVRGFLEARQDTLIKQGYDVAKFLNM